jgi:uncharacterized membrane protein YbaN (DUF454 family)
LIVLLLRLFLGFVFIILGIIGSILPVMQGWMFFLLAFLVLFPNSKPAAKILAKVEPRLPRLAAWLRKMGMDQ